MALPRLIRFALILLAIVAGGGLGGVFIAQFALSGLNPFYQNAPLPGPLVAVAEAAPAAPVPTPSPAPADNWSYPADPVDRIGYDPGPPDPSLDEDDPLPPLVPLRVDDRPAPRAPVVAIATPAPPVGVVAASEAPR